MRTSRCRLQWTDLHDVWVAASSAEHQRCVAVAVTHVEAALCIEKETYNTWTVVPDCHVQRRAIALTACVDVTTVTYQSTYHFCSAFTTATTRKSQQEIAV